VASHTARDFSETLERNLLGKTKKEWKFKEDDPEIGEKLAREV
jgi:hypothetical protein